MRAMIFAAGLGTRLKPFTLEHPKALVPVGGIPMLQRVIEKLEGYGIREIVVNVHHFADQIVDFLSANHNFGLDIHISDERSLLLDTGGGILAARKWLDSDDEPFLVHNADILTDFNIAEMADAHARSGAAATLLVAERETSRYLLLDSESRLNGWTNVKTGQVKPEGLDTEGLERRAFAGVHILSPKIFRSLGAYRSVGEPFSIIDYYIDSCRSIDIRGYQAPGKYAWHDIGKPESLAKAEASIMANNL